jgi:GTP-binding protein
MKFFDKVKIFVKSGKGGNGCVSFRREKFIPKGGPDGGNGGDGGDVILKINPNMNTLTHLHFEQEQKAEDGYPGMGKMQHGKRGKDKIIEVPRGTTIIDENETFELFDLCDDNAIFVIANGGRGGAGNTVFKSSVERAPRFAKKGHPGEEGFFILKLKLISDCGLVGLPSAGKSSFINFFTNTKQEVADYAFTTKKPKLGVIKGKDIVLCDIPGLIEGASEGVGLGIEFLQHIERCKIIIHLIDASSNDPYQDYITIINEMNKYNEDILKKKTIIAINKIDKVSKRMVDTLMKKISKNLDNASIKIFPISIHHQIGLEEILQEIENEITGIKKINTVH